MNKVGDIIIHSCTTSQGTNNRSSIEYRISNGEKTESLYFEVEKEYEKYLCSEVADGVVIAILSYAMRGGV